MAFDGDGWVMIWLFDHCDVGECLVLATALLFTVTYLCNMRIPSAMVNGSMAR